MQIKNFHIIRSLERNTLSELFLARHVHDGYYVKVRLYDQRNITNEEVREAILQRLRNSYQMRHRNIIATIDYGVEGRYMYQVQEHMDYGTLEDLLEKAGKIPPEIAVFLLQEILRGLHYAHSISLFHGMLNPSRVLLSSNGVVKIEDFQFLDLKNTFLKQVQTRIRRKQQMYLAPEQLLGKETDWRCDLFSTGVIAYKMLTGKHPFLEEDAEWTTLQIAACNAKLLFEVDPTLPEAIERLVESMMEKEVNRRIPSAEEALRQLEPYVEHFGEIRSYEVLAGFLKKPAESVEQLNLLRAEEYIQQAAQFQLKGQWDRALVCYYQAQFLKPKDKNIDNEIKNLCLRLGYAGGENKDPAFVQLEQSLRANPENIQILQRLATLAKSRGDLLSCISYYKRILKINPEDSFAQGQLRHLLYTQEKDPILVPSEARWMQWQEFYRHKDKPFFQRWSLLQGNISLIVAVLVFGCLIAVLHGTNLFPQKSVPHPPGTIQSRSLELVANQKIEMFCDQAVDFYRQGEIGKAVEILSKTPLLEKGRASARARLLLARYWLELEEIERSLNTLNSIDLITADFQQKIAVYKLKAEIYRTQKRFAYAIDQYISMKALPGLPESEEKEADRQILLLQQEATVP